MKKYVIVTGGVCSSLGKGLAAASLGSLLESRGLRIRMIKVDPYINLDAGTMSPYQHGEVYVTDDGAETDLDLGNYARFTNAPLTRANSVTTGQVYQEVIQREREGHYLGRTVQVIPHITDRIKQRILNVGEQQDVHATIVEIGGTVGDIESIPFLEAARQLMHELGHDNVLSVHLTLIPRLSGDELKTKPTQHSVKEMREIGIQPDILLCRTPREMDDGMRRKIALFTNVAYGAVISAHDVRHSIYEIPLAFHRQQLDQIVCDRLRLDFGPPRLESWQRVVEVFESAQEEVRIGVVGKYIDLADAYKSVDEALYHGGIANGVRVRLVKLDSGRLEKRGELPGALKDLDGVLVPGGFGARGIEGMVETARFCREHSIPYFGICLGLQVMVIEWARSCLGLAEADSTEFTPDTPDPVITLLEEQVDLTNYGGTMRLGANESLLMRHTRIRAAYGTDRISERHRHRYEVSNKYREQLGESGMILSGFTSDEALVESVEWPDHPWGVAVQFHPEFRSKPTDPHPLFAEFIRAAVERARGRNSEAAPSAGTMEQALESSTAATGGDGAGAAERSVGIGGGAGDRADEA